MMTENTMNGHPPHWVRAVRILLLIWNLIGVFAFISQMYQSPNAIAALPKAQRDLWLAMPMWDWIAYAIAVCAGTGGALALLMRKGWAVPLFALSIVGIIVQFSYPFLIAGAFKDLTMAAFPIFILAVAVTQWLLARSWRAKGWLT
jgi:hypothetical protein